MTRRQRIDDLTTFAVPGQPAISPDGGQCLYVLRTTDAEADQNDYAIWLVGTRTGQPRQLTRGKADTSPSWSPDGTKVVFLRSEQLWLLPIDGGEPEQLTTLALGAGAAAWSPDGTKIAFSAATDEIADANAPIVTERLDYQADGAGLLRTVRKHLHVLDVASKQCRQVTSGDWHAGDPFWSPDSATLAFSAMTAPDADLNFRAPVHVLDVSKDHATPEPVGLREGMAGPAIWTADGSALLVAGIEDGPVGHAGLWRVPLDGGAIVNLAKSLDRNVMPGGPGYPGAAPQLSADGSTVYFCVRDRGCTHLYSVPVEGRTPSAVVTGAGRVVGGLSVAGDTAAVLVSTPDSLGEIVTVDLKTGAENVRTGHGAHDFELFPREEREFTISDGTVVHGWLMRDPAATGPQPLLLDVHGGPHNAWNGSADEVHVYHQELVARGWTILLLNPRASDGYGEQFFKAGLGGWGEADAKDFLEPIDELVAGGIADAERLVVAGYSYGGYMTCYLTSRDNRFAAAVAGGVVSDLVSMVGTCEAGHYLSEFELGGQPWTGRRYDGMSPLSQVDRVRTPTLILHGTADIACPIGQAQQWHTALRELGVPTQFVLYPDASHLFILNGRPSHRIDYNRRIVDWLEQHTGTGRPRIDAAHWQRRLDVLAKRHRVPGATLGILRLRPGREDELTEAAYGVLNNETGVRTTTDSLFQVGSISKVWTTTVVMQLIDEGLLDLDAPIIEILPGLRLADPDATKKMTMRHLLTHTSGIDGDVFTDTGRGDDCLEKYVAQLAEVAQNHPLGATWSYCNSGFSLAGHVIEKLTGTTWDAAMKERLFTRLGLDHTVTLPEEALLYRTAVGHVAEGAGDPVKAPVWVLKRSAGPAGLITSTVADVLGFARMHLTGGLAPDGTRVLSEESAAAMTAWQVDLPDKHMLGDSWGLGWFRCGWDSQRLFGHDGNTIGQSAYLRVLPSEGLAVTLLTNGGNAHGLYEDLYREIFAELAGVAMPEPLKPPAEPVDADLDRHVGTYERASVLMDVYKADDGLHLRTTVTGPLAEMMSEKTQEYTMVPVDDNLFLIMEPTMQTWLPVTFYELATGERYLHYGVRATPKVG
ncbi:dipeptidyl aminopeptidase/acylaminoacyl peptidase [Kibdelosporangium banguiense]|uniref:Dipeptidyl aminopeptidase/acylaminoacyl peptidase n=1 Tax=Kibdelosporangium banguiense TaxID=1365924 RepID=A0ABS4TPS3_9PSEU|nr:serine hydrolase [Kibdelosporangium banguiense]MBP2326399.1 dipeptidyl aminopeptidase/acylaminoacyl peptidase [Kibdelosporangium banguiense]